MAVSVNPYLAGRAIRDDVNFFGRQDILAWVSQEFRNQNTNALVLFGQRRIGKTTLLFKISRFLPAEEYLPIFFDLQDQARRPLNKLLYDLAEAMSSSLKISMPDETKFDKRGNFFLKDFLSKFSSALGKKRRAVILFDEFDALEYQPNNDDTEDIAQKSLFPFLRRLMSQHPEIGFVFVAGRNPGDLTIDFNTIFKGALVKEVWVLDEQSAKDLIKQAEQNSTLKFSENAVDRIIKLTNCHPYLTQLLCQRIWEKAHGNDDEECPVIEITDVETAVEDTLNVGDAALQWLWSGLAPAERVFASALAESNVQNKPISEDDVIQVLSNYASRLRTKEVELAPRDLVKRRVLVPAGSREYMFAISLLHLWVQKNRPLEIVKEEIDKIDEPADQLFLLGKSYYQRQKHEEARRYFESAINDNKNHLNAHLFLGDLLLESKELDKAIVTLERAYELDRVEARLPLARALIIRAQSLYKQGKEAEAIKDCDKALELSPSEVEAQKLRQRIWSEKGDKSWDKKDWWEALRAYQQAGDTDKTQMVKQRMESEKQAAEKSIRTVNIISRFFIFMLQAFAEPFRYLDDFSRKISYEIFERFEMQKRFLGDLLQLVLLLLFLYADSVLGVNNLSAIFPQDVSTLPSWLSSGQTFSILVATVGVLFGMGLIFSDFSGVYSFGEWHLLKGGFRAVIMTLATLSFIFSLTAAVFIGLARYASVASGAGTINIEIANNINLMASILVNLLVVPLFISTSLFFGGVRGLIILFSFLLYLLTFIVRLIYIVFDNFAKLIFVISGGDVAHYKSFLREY